MHRSQCNKRRWRRVKEEFDIDKVSSKYRYSVGKQPWITVPVNDMQEYMLGELIKGLGLDRNMFEPTNP